MSPQPQRQKFKIGMLREGATRMTCVEAHCEHERTGWAVVLDPTTEKHAKAARWIEGDSGREFVKLAAESALDWLVGHGHEKGITLTPALRQLIARTPPGMLVFLFPPGQQCFRPHLDREVVFAHQRVGIAGGAEHVVGARVHTRAEDYIEHWNDESYRVNKLLRRG